MGHLHVILPPCVPSLLKMAYFGACDSVLQHICCDPFRPLLPFGLLEAALAT